MAVVGRAGRCALAVVAGACVRRRRRRPPRRCRPIVTTTTAATTLAADDHPAALLRGQERRHPERRSPRRYGLPVRSDHDRPTASPTPNRIEVGQVLDPPLASAIVRPSLPPSPRARADGIACRHDDRSVGSRGDEPFWPTADHWSVADPARHAAPAAAAARRARLRRPRRRRLRRPGERVRWRSSTWTGRAAATPTSPRSRRPTASSTAAGFWDKGKTDKDALWTSNAELVPTIRALRRRRGGQLRTGAGHQARAAGPRRGDPLDPPRRQQPLQPRRRGVGRALVAGADRQPRQLHAADGQRARRPARPGDRGARAAAPWRAVRRRHPAPVARRRPPRRLLRATP